MSVLIHLAMDAILHRWRLGSEQNAVPTATRQTKKIDYDLASFQDALVETIDNAKEHVVSIVISKELIFLDTPFFGQMRQTDPDIRTQKTQIGG